MKKALLVVLSFFLVVALLWGFFNTFSVKIVRGVSMQPTFGECTVVVAHKLFSPSDLVVGDVVVIENDAPGVEFSKFAHRVVSNNVGEMLIATRGDNVGFYDFPDSIDGFFSYSSFKGKVIWWIGCPSFLN